MISNPLNDSSIDLREDNILYQLKDGVFFVNGALQGAILDTNTGLVYSVNTDACSILNYLVQGDEYWQDLVSMGLAEQAIKINAQSIPEKDVLDALNFAWFEIVTDNCNERCVHCYSDSMPSTFRGPSQKYTYPELQDDLNVLGQNTYKYKYRMNYEDWLTIIKEAYSLGCKRCQFIGGEPFLFWGPNNETVLDLVEFAKNVGYISVEIFTNGTLITPNKIPRLKELGVKLAISLYSDIPETHDAITRTPGSHSKTINAIKLLQAAKIPLRVETVLMKSNQHTIESTLALKKELTVSHKNPDPLRPKGRGDNPALIPDFSYLIKYGLKLKPNFTVSREQLAHYKSGHSCLLGKIAVTENGDVLPCIFSRDHLFGNFLSMKNLSHIIKSKEVQQVWQNTKDNVLVCKDCEYRYVCFDCRPLSEAAAKGNATYLHAPYPRCTYNPYTGEWAQGLWSVDEYGQPYYDRSLAPQIEAIAQVISTESDGFQEH